MTFQVSDLKGKSFLDLVDRDNNILEPFCCKGGTWLQFFSHSNTLCTRATRAITNHALIEEFRLRFFSYEDFSCLCGLYPIESRRYILYKCRRFNKYWNPRQDLISHFIQFLERNPKAFAWWSFYLNSFIYLGSFSFFFCFFLFFSIFLPFLFLSSCCIYFHVYSYEVATTVCRWILCNKLLI